MVIALIPSGSREWLLLVWHLPAAEMLRVKGACAQDNLAYGQVSILPVKAHPISGLG